MYAIDLGFPLWVRVTHWFNVLFVTLLIRSGLAILAAHPKLYWNEHCRPGSEWLKFTRKTMPTDRLWTSQDEEEEFPSWLALPGGQSLGLGRYWHFTAAHGWIYATGIYVILLLLMPPQWRRLIPSSWVVFTDAWHAFVAYITFHLPEPGNSVNSNHPYNALQQLTYFGLTFVLTPIQLLTGVAMSPAVEARFPWYPKLFGNRQAARSIHFLGMVLFVVFIITHVTMVILHGFAKEMNKMVMGREGAGWWGAGVGLGIITAVVLVHVFGNLLSKHAPRLTHRMLSPLVDLPRKTLLHHEIVARSYDESEISPYFRVNGYPPVAEYPSEQGGDDTYDRLRQNGFADYRLEVWGLVTHPLSLSLDDLRALPRQEQITMHVCIQGWTAVGKWAGVPLAEILDRCQPLPQARYVVLHSYQFHKQSGRRYYECIDFLMARLPQTILAYEMNGTALPVEHGAPLRVRCEPKLGFKMVKYLRAIEIVEDYRNVGEGMGGIREDHQQFDLGAEI